MMIEGDRDLKIDFQEDFDTGMQLVKFTKYTFDGRRKTFILVIKDSDFFEVSEGATIPRRHLG